MSSVTFARFDEGIPEPAAVMDCAQCGGEVYVGDEVTRFEDGAVVHGYCVSDYLRGFIATNGIINSQGEVE